MKLSEKITELRKQNGMTQEDLACELNVSRQAISRWEMGTSMPDASNILQLSKLFNVTSDYLLNDDYKSDNDLPKLKEYNHIIKENDLKQAKSFMISGYLSIFAAICFVFAAAIDPDVHPLVYINILLCTFAGCLNFYKYSKIKK